MQSTFSQWLSFGLLTLFVCGFCYMLYQGNTLVDELVRRKQHKTFMEDLTLTLIHKGKALSLQQIQQIAETRGVTQHEIQRCLKILLREVLAQRNLSLQEHQSYIEGLIKEMKIKEPFDGLPNELRIHLERLRDDLHQTPEKLEPLTIQIRELATLKSREYRLQKYYTVGGFAVGLVGLAFAAFAYWVPHAPDNGTRSIKTTANIESPAGKAASKQAVPP